MAYFNRKSTSKHGCKWYNTAVATVAQLVEQAFRKRQVAGSIPTGGSSSLFLTVSCTWIQI